VGKVIYALEYVIPNEDFDPKSEGKIAHFHMGCTSIARDTSRHVSALFMG
jgi:hypothetical protein